MNDPTWGQMGALASAFVALTQEDLSHDLLMRTAAPMVREMLAMLNALEKDPHGDSEIQTRNAPVTDLGSGRVLVATFSDFDQWAWGQGDTIRVGDLCLGADDKIVHDGGIAVYPVRVLRLPGKL